MLRAGLLILVFSFLFSITSSVESKTKVTKSIVIKPGMKIGDVCINPKDGAEMLWVPAGEFIMGSSDTEINAFISAHFGSTADRFENEIPQHKVYLDGYWIYQNKISMKQYQKFCLETGHKISDWGRWKDVVAYTKWAGVTLPTEAQWEKAARGTDGRSFPWGNRQYYSSDSDEDSKKSGTTQPITRHSYNETPFGCMDMGGNTWEWCADWYGYYYYKNSPYRNPTGPVRGIYRVLRGGGWTETYFDDSCRCATRYYGRPNSNDKHDYHAFRCVRIP